MAREIELDMKPESGCDPNDDGAENERVKVFSLGLGLDDIPDPTGGCSLCEAPMQKEFLEYKTTREGITVVGLGAPGYGCTGCGEKELVEFVVVKLLDRTAEIFGSQGKPRAAEFFQHDADVWRDKGKGELSTSSEALRREGRRARAGEAALGLGAPLVAGHPTRPRPSP